MNLNSPLHLTAMHGQEDITRLLISSGAAIESRDALLQTPLHRYGHMYVNNVPTIVLVFVFLAR